MPNLNGDSLSGRANEGQKLIQTLEPVRRQVQGLSFGVDIPAEDSFSCGPTCVTFQHFLFRGRLRSMRGRVVAGHGPEHGINSVQSVPEHSGFLVMWLRHQQKIIHIHIHCGDGRGTLGTDSWSVEGGRIVTLCGNGIGRRCSSNCLQPMSRVVLPCVTGAQLIIRKVTGSFSQRGEIGGTEPNTWGAPVGKR